MAAPENTQLSEHSIDPNVRVPRHILEASAAAEALHAQAYPAEPAPVDPNVDPNLAPGPDGTIAPQPELPPAPVTATVTDDNFTAPAASQDLKDSIWAGRYNAMRGRYEAAQRQIGSMDEQLRAIAGELTASQGLLEQLQRGGGAPAAHQPQSGQHHDNLITDTDRDTYGQDLIDLTQRAARAAVGPELDNLRAENQDLKKRVVTTAQSDLRQALATAVPNWVEINRSPEFNSWLRLPNSYSGDVRGRVLKAAYGSANAQRVIAIFKDFITEVRATGGDIPGSQPSQVQGHTEPPTRQAAVALESLAAPGRARPSGGGDPQAMNADKPIYSRAQIAANYANKRKGLYSGRDDEWNRIDADMIAAGREGRIR